MFDPTVSSASALSVRPIEIDNTQPFVVDGSVKPVALHGMIIADRFIWYVGGVLGTGLRNPFVCAFLCAHAPHRLTTTCLQDIVVRLESVYSNRE